MAGVFDGEMAEMSDGWVAGWQECQTTGRQDEGNAGRLDGGDVRRRDGRDAGGSPGLSCAVPRPPRRTRGARGTAVPVALGRVGSVAVGFGARAARSS